MEKNVKKQLWIEAANGGMAIGLALVVVLVVAYLGRLDVAISWVSGLANFLVLAAGIVFFAKRAAKIKAAEGFSFGQSMSFIIKMMLFAGFIAGLGQFVMQNYVDPEYYKEIVELALVNAGLSDAQIEEGMKGMDLLKSPIMMIFSGAINMIIYGGLIGVLVSIFVKTPVNIFADSEKKEEQNQDNA